MNGLLTKKQVSEKLNISERTVERWMDSGKIPFYKIHGMIRFDEEKINNWLRSKEVKPVNI